MSKNLDFSQFANFASKFEGHTTAAPKAVQSAANEVAGKLLAETRRRTPVRKKIDGEIEENANIKAGKLRRGWTAGNPMVTQSGTEISVFNNVEYASYVEYGHRGVYVPSLGKTLHLSTHWTTGKFVLKRATDHIRKKVDKICKEHADRFVRSIMQGGDQK